MPYRFNPFSLVDSPTGSACVVYVKGCPFTCGYCFNPELRSFEESPGEDLDLDDILIKIGETRKVRYDGGIVKTADWCVVSGGEPLSGEIGPLVSIFELTSLMDLRNGIYTSGAYPDKLRSLMDLHLSGKIVIDYIHIDYKYDEVLQRGYVDKKTLESINYIATFFNHYVFLHINTTIVKSIHTIKVLREMRKNILNATGIDNIPVEYMPVPLGDRWEKGRYKCPIGPPQNREDINIVWTLTPLLPGAKTLSGEDYSKEIPMEEEKDYYLAFLR